MNPWETEDWRKAKGIPYNEHETNSGLARRDYSVKCEILSQNKIMVINGFWLWWCSAHYQPFAWCEKAKLKEKVITFANAVELADRTEDYDYDGSNSSNRKGEKPPAGTRWLAPRELAREFLKSLKK